MIYSHQDLQIRRNLFSVKVRHNFLMTLRIIGYSLNREVLKIQNRKKSANLNYFGSKMFFMF